MFLLLPPTLLVRLLSLLRRRAPPRGIPSLFPVDWSGMSTPTLASSGRGVCVLVSDGSMGIGWMFLVEASDAASGARSRHRPVSPLPFS